MNDSECRSLMFCNEIIEKVYSGQPNYGNESEYLLDCYYDMAIHIYGAYRLILETENYYISLEADGVFLLAKTGPVESIKKDGEWIDPCIHVDEEDEEDVWVDYESTLFVGERLLSLEETKDGQILTFDDFKITLIAHSSYEEFPFSYAHPYSRVYGTERLIKKCRCGGIGELDIDFVSDYGVRCNRCHRGTMANQCACDAIDEWNEMGGLYDIGYYPEEEFRAFCHEPVEYIVIEEFYDVLEDNSICCNSIIVKFGDKKFKISNRYAGNGNYDFCFETLSDFNPEVWPKRIGSEKYGQILFYKKDDLFVEGPSLVFRVGDGQLFVTAIKDSLIISPLEATNKGGQIQL